MKFTEIMEDLKRELKKIYKQYTDQLEAIAEEKGLAEKKEWLEKLNEIEII